MNPTPILTAYALACLVLCINALFLWAYSGVVRARSRTVVNPEDTRAFAGTELVATDPPEVARVLRAHANAIAVLVPFAIGGLLYVLLDGPLTLGASLFAVFGALRWAHSLAYLAARQPYRTAAFVGSALALVGLLGSVGWLVVR